jgi:hypothetical protein
MSRALPAREKYCSPARGNSHISGAASSVGSSWSWINPDPQDRNLERRPTMKTFILGLMLALAGVSGATVFADAAFAGLPGVNPDHHGR